MAQTTRKNTITRIVRILMDHHHEKQTLLAAVLGVKPPQVSTRMKGTTAWTIDDLDRMAEHWGIPVGMFFMTDEEVDKWEVRLEEARRSAPSDLRFGDSGWMFGQAETGTGSDLIAI